MKKCYRECPKNTILNNYYCEVECPESLPYEILKTQECVNNCTVNEINKKMCILNKFTRISKKTSKKINEWRNRYY